MNNRVFGIGYLHAIHLLAKCTISISANTQPEFLVSRACIGIIRDLIKELCRLIVKEPLRSAACIFGSIQTKYLRYSFLSHRDAR